MPGPSEARLLGGPNSFGWEVVGPSETVVIAEGVSSGLKSALRHTETRTEFDRSRN